MAYVSKVWKNRQVEYPNRRIITHDNLTQEVVSVNRSEGAIIEAGDVLDAENMNGLESRINAGFQEKQDTLIAGANITISGNIISASGGGGGASIDDTTTSTTTTWSSSKIDTTKMDKSNPSGTGMLSMNRRSSQGIADGLYSVTLGDGNTALGNSAIAEGSSTEATGNYSHAEGLDSEATGVISHAEGYACLANGNTSHAQGHETVADGESQFVFGRYNVADANDTYVEIVGNGEDTDERSNARTLDWNGNEYLAGNLTVGGNVVGYIRMKDVTGTLVAGNTTLIISDSSITTDSTIQVFCGVDGIEDPTKVISTGSVTLTFATALSADLAVKVRVS